MESSISFEGELIELTQQTGLTSFETTVIHLSQIERFSYRRPSLFSRGLLQFHLVDETSTEAIEVKKEHRHLFDELVSAIQEKMESDGLKWNRKAQVTIQDSAIHPENHAGRSEENLARGYQKSVVSSFNPWVAVDIEWADSSNPTSVCEIGFAKFKNGELVDTWSAYVKPAGSFKVGEFEFKTHGIGKELLHDAKTLSELWPDIDQFIGDCAWVLHNGSKDIKNILETLARQGHPGPREFQYIDTMRLAGKLPQVTSKNGLLDLTRFFGISREYARYDGREHIKNPHGAKEDAVQTGRVLNKLLETVSFTDVSAFLALLDAYPGEVRQNEIIRKFSAAGKFKYPTPEEIPTEAELARKVEKEVATRVRVESKRESAEEARARFLVHPEWSTMRVTAGTRVCFTQLMPWDDNREFGFDEEVRKIAKQIGLVEQGVNKQLELLIVNDPWVAESAKLRDCLAKEIPVTTYSIFQQNNPEFPVWNYKNAEQYRWLRSQGDWPQKT